MCKMGRGFCYPYQDRPLHDTIHMLRTARVLVGTSSGPMHLGALCGTPLVVFSSERNRRRYETDWNPFNVPVKFIPTWHPSVGQVQDAIGEVLNAQK